MSISFGSLGLMSLRNPLADAVGILWGKGDIRSMFWLVVFYIFFLILAYLTNPSETSFRTFLTEQSFRQHLSRLDDSIDDDHDPHGTKSSVRRGVNSITHTLPFDNRSPFHFANRASVSLRTPKHVFHTCGVFTIAVILPTSKSDRDPVDRRSDSIVSVISDSWYLGAFGKWWRGGVLDEWYHNVIAGGDEESWSSGVLGMKTSERHHEYNGALPGLPFTTKNLPPHLLSRGSPPRLRNRDKSSQRSSSLPIRSSTPPPLPKSVSLPLHATRSSQVLMDHSVITQHPSQSLPSFPIDPVNAGAQLPSTSPLTVFDQSPHVAELLRQVTASTSSILDLRNQLSDCKISASQSHTTLQRELESCRERKRQEDSMRAELKSRTKALDDSKRQAESMRRDSEKRLKAAFTARNDTKQRIEHLDSEILHLQKCLVDDEASVRHSKDTESPAEQTIKVSLEQRRTEVKIADNVVVALNIRARELEKRLTIQKERLQSLRERFQSQQLTRSLHHGFHVIDPPSSSWSLKDSPFDIIHSATLSSQGDSLRDDQTSGHSPEPSELIIETPSDHVLTSVPIPLRGNAYTRMESDLPSLAVQTSQPVGKFAPFAEFDPHPSQSSMAVSPTSSSLIPSGLMSSLALDNTDSISRSFQSENDVFLDRHWRNNGVHGHRQRLHTDEHSPKYGTMTTSSPTSLHAVSTSDADYDPFEVRMLTPRERERYSLRSESAMDMQRASLFHRNSSSPSLVHPSSEEFDPAPGTDKPSAPRRWFSKVKAAKGLNPDAKVFSISGSADSQKQGHFSQISFDALNPHGLGANVMAPTSDSSTLLRAFAPSPAEREVLQRAFGGSTNTSLERLPNLSDVGSIPPSPSHVNAHVLTVPVHDRIPTWLQSLPRIRKPNFSPWDDEEPSANKKVLTSDEGGHGGGRTDV
ncbi:uncharacterized protein BT62DRAFT_968124 [Guyanagaster necrorhizus]|uniref:Proteophosphoglycan ppg4 n=1 Tax=Guyanagaster necrorhizus TaxID=856835 RepID=A0A9P8ATZ7_9AGAR|nr:uncharacterized protein BT62DRAFT_968124 [Guyanagaster necrorhizus MCA 3950]KAG7446377.1 hypothetical protein BT62DRAFT_968124 [Guyanagaster necrorhizus MCA 3950]